jgi:hypothetical protein
MNGNGGILSLDSAERLCVKEPVLAQLNTLRKANVYNYKFTLTYN